MFAPFLGLVSARRWVKNSGRWFVLFNGSGRCAKGCGAPASSAEKCLLNKAGPPLSLIAAAGLFGSRQKEFALFLFSGAVGVGGVVVNGEVQPGVAIDDLAVNGNILVALGAQVVASLYFAAVGNDLGSFTLA